MSALSVLSIALYRNASLHEHPCTVVALALAWHLSLRVDVTSKAVYEIVAEPIPEPQAGEPQAEAAAEPDPEDLVNPADLQGKPRSITLILSIQCLFKYFVHLRSRSCMEL